MAVKAKLPVRGKNRVKKITFLGVQHLVAGQEDRSRRHKIIFFHNTRIET
jgi:hypothetical protein